MKDGIANLALTSIGAGILSLSFAYSTIGLWPGVVLSLMAGYLTFASCSVIIRYCATFKKESYGELTYHVFGPMGRSLLQGSIILHVVGVMIVYLVIIGDMLVGNDNTKPPYNGLLPFLLGIHVDLPFYVSRWFVTGTLLVVIGTPMFVARDLNTVSKFSKLSVFFLLYLGGTLVFLSVISRVQGKMPIDEVILWPDVDSLGGGVDLISAILKVFAVNALAFTCQFNLASVHNSLQDNRTSIMLHVVKSSIALCGGLYIVVAVAGYALFGSSIEGDVLKNLTIDFASTLIGRHLATVVIGIAIAAYTFCLLTNFALKVWAVRNACCELLIGCQASLLTRRSFYLSSALLVLFSFIVSIIVPSVWFVVSLVGSTACVTFSYVFPGMLLYRVPAKAGDKTIGVIGIVLAALMAVSGIVSTLHTHK